MPSLSIIIPTLNAAEHLPKCLDSIIAQKGVIPEILIVDGGSSDATLKIAAHYRKFADVLILPNAYKTAEQGKRLGLKYISEESRYVMFMDADNELIGDETLAYLLGRLDISAPSVFGVEPKTLPSGNSLNRYLTSLEIHDPLSNCIARLCGNYPTGANGFIYKREHLVGLSTFEDTEVAERLKAKGLIYFRMGYYCHHYATNLLHFLLKRRRQAYHYKVTPKEHNWINSKPKVILAVLWCSSFVGPLIIGLFKWWTTGERFWIWHPIACPMSVIGAVWGTLTPRRDNEHDLQPK